MGVDSMIYPYIPIRSDIDFEKVEEAIGFKLFVWQKTYIEYGMCRRCGKTTALILRALLNDIDKCPIELSKRPKSIREDLYKERMLEIREKLVSNGVPCRGIRII